MLQLIISPNSTPFEFACKKPIERKWSRVKVRKEVIIKTIIYLNHGHGIIKIKGGKKLYKNKKKSEKEVRNLFWYRPETILSGAEAHLAVWVLSACR